jgi:hypothetical protein
MPIGSPLAGTPRSRHGVNYRCMRIWQCWLVASAIAFAAAVQAQTLSRDATASNLDLSGLPEEMHMPLVTDGDVPLGVFRHHAANGVILMGSNGPISFNAGMFFGSADKTYPKEISCTIVRQQGEVQAIKDVGPYTTYKADNRACKMSNIWWEGIIAGYAKILNVDGSNSGMIAVVTPRAGKIANIKIGTEDLTITKSDIGDATLKVAGGKTYRVLFQASVRGQMCYLVAQ